MKNKSVLKYARFAALLCGIILLAISLSGCAFGTMSSRSLENPKHAIVGFVEAMQADEFDAAAAEAASQYIGNYSTMGFEKYAMLENGSLEKALFDMLRDSYKVSFADESMDDVSSPYTGEDMNISGKQAYVTFTFTSLALDEMSEPLAEAVSEIGAERMYEGETYDTEESAMVLVEEVFDEVFKKYSMSQYYVEHELTVELNYMDDGWKLSMSNELYDALLGR